MRKSIALFALILVLSFGLEGQTNKSFYKTGEKVLSDTCGFADYFNYFFNGSRDFDGIHSVNLDGEITGLIPITGVIVLPTVSQAGEAALFTKNGINAFQQLKGMNISTISKIVKKAPSKTVDIVNNGVAMTKLVWKDYTLVVDKITLQIVTICKTNPQWLLP